MVLMVGGVGGANYHSHNLRLYGTGSGKRYFVFGLGSGVVKRPVSLVAGHQKSCKFCISLSYLILTRAGLKGLNASISLYLTFRNFSCGLFLT